MKPRERQVRPVPKGRAAPPISEEVLCAEYESVYRYVLALCRSDTDAQDITQETFLKAMKSADRFEGSSSLYTWLCAIAKNLWLNQCKRDSRQAPAEPDQPLADSAVPLEQYILEQDLSMQIHQALHSLSDPYKEVFSLRVFGQLSFAQIAQLFGKTESWARVTCHRARKMITEKMRKDGTL